MPFNLILNSSNVTNFDNTTFQYDFVNGFFDIEEGSEVCVSQIDIPYSFFNLNLGLYNNTLFQFSTSIDNVTTNYSVRIPDGYYDTDTLNKYLEQYFITNGLYYCDNTGSNYYFIKIYYNSTYYANQIIVSPIISSEVLGNGNIYPVNYVNNTSVTGYTLTIIFPNTGGLNDFLGFNAGSYPTTSSNVNQLNFISNKTPITKPINSIIIRSNLCNNDCASPSDVLDTISVANVKFGELISYVPSYEKWINCSYGTFLILLYIFKSEI